MLRHARASLELDEHLVGTDETELLARFRARTRRCRRAFSSRRAWFAASCRAMSWSSLRSRRTPRGSASAAAAIASDATAAPATNARGLLIIVEKPIAAKGSTRTRTQQENRHPTPEYMPSRRARWPRE